MPNGLRQFKGALLGQESGGNYEAENGRTGAYGGYQIMPDNWPSWSENAGLSGAEPTPENQEYVVDHKLQEYYSQFGNWRDVAIAWYAGPGAVNNPQYNYDRKQGNGDEPSINEYADSVIAKMQGGTFAPSAFVRKDVDPFGGRASLTPTKEPQAAGVWEQTKDKFMDSWLDSTVIGAGRLTWKNIQAGDYGKNLVGSFEATQEDIDFVTKALPDNFTAQKFVLMNASSRENLALLIQAKQEDLERRERVENYSYGLSTAGTIAGALLDPLNLVPFAGGAAKGVSLGTKVTARLGGYAPPLNKFIQVGTRYGQTFATYGALNTIERYGAEATSGYEQDYTSAFLIGGAFGILAPAALKGLQHMAGYGNKGAQKIVGALDNMETHGVSQAMDAALPNARKVSFETAKSFHDVSFVEKYKAGSKYLTELAEGNKVFAVTRKQANELGALLKTKIPKGAKAFYNEAEDYTVLISDNIKAGTSIDNLLAHEVGVHAGLRKNLGDKVYEDVKATVEKKMEKPTKEWQEAMRSVPNGGWEEVLGHYMERTSLKDPLAKRLVSNAAKGLRKLGYKGNLTEVEMKDFVKRAIGKEVEKANGFITNPDGSVVMNGLKYSAESLTNPHNLQEHYDLQPHLERQKDLGWFKGLGRHLESNGFFGTIHGTLANSKSHVARQIADTLFTDARMRGAKGALVMPVEDMAKHIQTRLNIHMAAYWDYRTNHLFGDINKKVSNTMNHRAMAQEFNQQVLECYNATYSTNRAGLASTDFPAHAKEAARILHNLREEIVDLGKKSSEMFGTTGKNLIDADWKALDNELWRILDEDKWMTFTNKFGSVQDAQAFLSDYAQKAVKKDLVKAKLLEAKNKEALAAWEKAKSSLKKGELEPKKPKAITEIPEEELKAHIEQEAKEWALGIIDRDNSNLEFIKNKGTGGDLPFFRERLPMDTTMILETPFGEKFSFDTTLRDTDLDRIVPKVIQRFSGEAALNNVFKNPEDLVNTRAKLESQLKHAVSQQHMIESDMARELKAFDEGISSIRGVRNASDVKGTWDAFAALFTRLSYAQNGANMGFNQLGEVGGAIGYTGGRALLHLFPSLAETVRAAKSGKLGAEAIEAAERRAFGDTLEPRIWSNASSYESRIIKEATTMGSKLRHFDKIGTGLNYASKLVSQVNMLPALTDRMIRGARADMIADSLEWAVGKKVGIIGNPFSITKLKAAGIDDTLAEAIKADLRSYTKRGSDGKLKDFDVERWMAEKPETFFKWKQLVDNQGRRAIQQNTIGNKNLLKDANAFTRLAFQFKDFTLKAVNGQTMRALTNREADDALAAMFSMATNGLVYAGLTYMRAEVYFGDDPIKKQKYLDDRLSLEKIGTAMVLRGVITGSALSFGMDGYEAATGAQSFRTTVDRTSQFGRQQEGVQSAREIAGNVIGQFPAVRAMESALVDTPTAVYRALSPSEQITQRDLKNLYRNLPLQNFIPAVWLSNQMIEDSGLPRK